MRNTPILTVILLLVAIPALGQAPTGDPMSAIAAELSSISRSVQSLNATTRAFIEKFEKISGNSLNEKQQKLVMAMELLVKAEERLAVLQRSQVELVERQGTTRTRLAQVDRDAFPQSIDRSVAFEGTTKTEELRENRRSVLQAEKQSLQMLLQQINSNLADTTEAVRDAQLMVQRLRRQYLPQIEREIFDPTLN